MYGYVPLTPFIHRILALIHDVSTRSWLTIDGVTHVLVVEDEPYLLRALTMNLSGRGYHVSAAPTAGAALTTIAVDRPDLMILDLGLPDMDGMDVLRHVRERDRGMPIVVLSARWATEVKVAAFELGANDYVTKPFDMSELVARLRAASRRSDIAEPDQLIHLGPITVDLVHQRITHSGDLEPIRLSPTEWRMLDTLLRNPNAIVTSLQLLVAMRGDPEHTESSYLRNYIRQLRRKLEVDPSRPRYFITEPGLGYRYLPERIHEDAADPHDTLTVLGCQTP